MQLDLSRSFCRPYTRCVCTNWNRILRLMWLMCSIDKWINLQITHTFTARERDSVNMRWCFTMPQPKKFAFCSANAFLKCTDQYWMLWSPNAIMCFICKVTTTFIFQGASLLFGHIFLCQWIVEMAMLVSPIEKGILTSQPTIWWTNSMLQISNFYPLLFGVCVHNLLFQNLSQSSSGNCVLLLLIEIQNRGNLCYRISVAQIVCA